MAWRYPDDDPLRRMRSHNVALTVGLGMQRHHQHEIPASTHANTPGADVTKGAAALICGVKWRLSPLIGVGLALLPHVVCCGLAKMEPPHCDLCDLLWRQGDPWSSKITDNADNEWSARSFSAAHLLQVKTKCFSRWNLKVFIRVFSCLSPHHKNLGRIFWIFTTQWCFESSSGGRD